MKIKKLSIKTIREGYHPRKDFSRKEKLKESIEKEGLLEPLSVRQDGHRYIVIDGVMRFRVVKDLDWKEVDCVIIDADEEKAYHLAYVKNTERNNLNPIEESLHLNTVQDKFGYNVEDLVRQGYAPHRSTLDNKISLLSLPDDIQKNIADGTIKPTIGYHLAKLKDEDLRGRVSKEVLASPEITTAKVEQKVKALISSRKREGKENHPPVRIVEGDIPGVFFKDSSDMSEIQDEKVALIFTSPGYCVGMEYEKNVTLKDHLKNLKQHCREWNRVLMKGGIVAVNFGDIHNFRTQNGGKVEIQLMGHYYQTFLRKHNIRLRDVITWRKGKTWINNPQVSYHQKTKHTSYRILNNFEYIYIFYKEGNREVPFDIEYESKISKEEWKEWVDGVWEIPPVRRQEGHPAQFPEELPRRLIRMYSYKGDIVLDPFGGTMTTVKVANELGRIGIGYEKEEKYKPVIMEKLGITEQDLKKPEVDEDRRTKLADPQFTNKFEGMITQILADNNKTTKDIACVRIPAKSAFLKDEIAIDWVKNDEEPDPSGPDASPQLLKADDYEDLITNPSDSQFLLPERCSDISPHLNRIILGDCLEKLKDIPDNSVDFAPTDPPYGIKFMGKNWDKAVPTVAVWKELLRVLKPGAFSFVMSIPRQDCQSHMISNLEEAGFKVDFSPIYWTYAQGFPKAADTYKIASKKGTTEPKLKGSKLGFQPKPAVEVILVAMKPMDEKTYVGQALKNGKGITWMDDCRIPYKDSMDKSKSDKCCEVNGNNETGLIWGGKKVLDIPRAGKRTKDFFNEEGKNESWNASDKGRFPANLLISDDVLDDGKKHPGGGVGGRAKHNRGKGYGFKPMGKNAPEIPKDSGGYSRFFSLDAWAEKNVPFLIVPKPSKREKGKGNNHPTVKPIKLMCYLITMGSREGDVVLDPFCGSGTTCMAAKILKRKFIGIERDVEHQKFAEKKVENVAMAKAA